MQVREHMNLWIMLDSIANYAANNNVEIIAWDDAGHRSIGFISVDNMIAWQIQMTNVLACLIELNKNGNASKKQCRIAQLIKNINGRRDIAQSFTDNFAIHGIDW